MMDIFLGGEHILVWGHGEVRGERGKVGNNVNAIFYKKLSKSFQ